MQQTVCTEVRGQREKGKEVNSVTNTSRWHGCILSWIICCIIHYRIHISQYVQWISNPLEPNNSKMKSDEDSCFIQIYQTGFTALIPGDTFRPRGAKCTDLKPHISWHNMTLYWLMLCNSCRLSLVRYSENSYIWALLHSAGSSQLFFSIWLTEYWTSKLDL